MVTCVSTVEGDKVTEGIDCLLSCTSGLAGELTNLEVRERHRKKTGNEKRLAADIRR